MSSSRISFDFWWSRHYPKWSLRTERYANGQVSRIVQLWWLGAKVIVGNE